MPGQTHDLKGTRFRTRIYRPHSVQAKEFPELGFGYGSDTQGAGFVQFAAGVLASDDVIGLPAHRRGGVAAPGPDGFLGLSAAEPFQRARDDKSESRERFCTFYRRGFLCGRKAESGTGNVILAVTAEPPTGDVKLTTGVGNVRLKIPPDAPGTFTCETGVGSVSVTGHQGITVAKSAVSAEAKGTVGQGGPNYTLETGVGSVVVE